MFCDHCGAENREAAHFCNKCGTDLSLIPNGEKEKKPVGPADAAPLSLVIDESTDREYLNSLLYGRYELKELLGRGGMGMAYRAYDKQLGMDVAIKFLLSRYTNDPAAIEGLKKEAKAAMRLAHPNIVRLYNFEDTPRLKYLLMECIEGESLSALAAKRTGRRLSEPEVIRYMCEVCDALAYAHRENIIHRDIKPSNILITNEGRVKLTDFGIALINEKNTAVADSPSGTPSYMSPEQVLGQPLDGRSDIYSLGVTMYEMLAGKTPFRGRDTRFKYVSMLPEPIEGVSHWLNAVIIKCLRNEPVGRWTNAEELRDVLSGKKEGGLALKGKFQPWWIVAEDQRKSEPPKAPPAAAAQPEEAAEPAPPDYARAGVQKTPAPLAPIRTKERVEKIERYAGLIEYASEREQSRVTYAVFAGVVAGIFFYFLTRDFDELLSKRVLLQSSFTLYGALFGIAVGLAHKKPARAILSFSFGVLGGVLAAAAMETIPDKKILIEMQKPESLAICGAILGASLGVADGIYKKSVRYTIRCALWGGASGGAGIGLFLVLRYLFSGFWSPLLNWVIMGASLAFAIMMGIGLAKKPGIDEEGRAGKSAKALS